MCQKCYEILDIKGNPSKQNEWIRANVNRYEHKCICGHQIIHNFPIMNKKTKEILVLGSKCILMIFADNSYLVEYATYIFCECCDKNVKITNAKKHDLTKKHIKNHKKYIKKKNNRPCHRCLDYTVPLSKPDKYKYCLDCFKYMYVKTNICPEEYCNNKISGNQLDKYKRCYTCNIESNKTKSHNPIGYLFNDL